ncbi:hypothetical protein OEZ86_003108 [Tetradesmus obliquus]|nr:hypothetical protein OEZ86_003108 [Tetradesmus obliquus]
MRQHRLTDRARSASSSSCVVRNTWHRPSGRAAATIKAELTVDRPKLATPPETSSGSSSDGQQQLQQQASACPFLASLPSPPKVKIPWHKRFQQLFAPQQFQATVLGGSSSSVVQVDKAIGFTNFVMPSDPELVRDAFAGELDGTTLQSNIKSFVALMGEHSLVLVQEPRHKYLRGLLQPAFSGSAISGYLPAIQALVGRHLAEWEAAGEAGVQGYDGLKLLTYEFIISITLGREYSRQEVLALSEHYKQWTSGFLAWPWLDLPFTAFGRSMCARNALLDHFQQAVTAARSKLAAGQQVPGIIGSLTAAVDEEGNRLTDLEITENILLLLLAGHDTSSTTLTRLLSVLHDTPEVVQQLRQEQAAVLARHGEQLTAAAIKDMEYADAVIRESLRLDPVVAGLFRVAAKDIDMGGYMVPKDTPILLPLHHLAVNDARWAGQTGQEDPASFHPERMLTEEGRQPGAQMPFGSGPRFCLGERLAMAEMKVVLALLMRQYDFSVDNNTEWMQAVGRVPKNGLPLKLRRLAQPVAAV